MAAGNIISYLELEEGFTGMDEDALLVWDDRVEIPAGEFYERAEAFAVYLMEQGFWNDPVAVLSEHVPQTLELYLGVLLSGNYYVPVAEEWTPQRRCKVLDLIQAEEVFDKTVFQRLGRQELQDGDRRKQEEAGQREPEGTGGRKQEEAERGKTKDAGGRKQEETGQKDGCRDVRKKLRQARQRLPENAPLYLIYTSGSTGEPKGILKTHENMIAFMEAYLEVFHFRDSDVMANQTPFCFDASAKDFYLMWKERLPMYIVDASMFLRPKDLVRRMNQYRISILQWVPSALSMLSQLKSFEKEKPEFLRRVSFVGEVFPVRQLAYWQSRLPSCEYYNLYGASEMAGICCYYKVKSVKGEQISTAHEKTSGMSESMKEYETIPLGRPLPRQKVYLVQDGHLVTEPGEQGEICIQSGSIAAGYYGGEEEGGQAFVSYLTEEVQGERYYRTGDLGRYDAEGNLCFAGRRDDQIKHMGHRIELGEIEQAALRQEQVERAAAVYEKGRIWLYCQGNVSKPQVVEALRERLPEYMMPQKVEIVDEIPLNLHGKGAKFSMTHIIL